MQTQARSAIDKKSAAAQTIRRDYTLEEYLALEEKAIGKSEYHDGEIIPMTGGTTNHNKIAGSFYKKFPLTINDQDYEIFINDVRLWISQIRRYFYCESKNHRCFSSVSMSTRNQSNNCDKSFANS